MKCCGVSQPGDWLKNGTFPSSCCEGKPENCTLESGMVYPDGCYEQLYTYIVGSNYIIGLSLTVTAVTEVTNHAWGLWATKTFL